MKVRGFMSGRGTSLSAIVRGMLPATVVTPFSLAFIASLWPDLVVSSLVARNSGGDLNPVEQMLVPQLAEASSNARSSPVMFGDQLPPPPWMGVLEPNPNPNPDPHAGFPPTANPNPSRDYDDDGDDDYLHGYRHGYGPGLGYDNDNDNDNDNDMGESTGAVRDQGAGESTAMATDQGMEEGTAMVLDQGVDEGTGMVLETGTAMVLEKGTAMVLDLGAEEGTGAIQREGLDATAVEAAADAAAKAAVAAAVARGHEMRAAALAGGGSMFHSAPTTPAAAMAGEGMPSSSSASALSLLPTAAPPAPVLPTGMSSFFPIEAGKEETSVSAAAAAAKEARQRQRGQVRTYSEEADAAPLKQTVVATVVGNPDVSADGAREGEAFDGRVRLLERERGYRGPNRVAGAGRGGRGRGGEHAWNSAAVTAALAAADGGDAKATVEGVGGEALALVGWLIESACVSSVCLSHGRTRNLVFLCYRCVLLNK